MKRGTLSFLSKMQIRKAFYTGVYVDASLQSLWFCHRLVKGRHH